MDEKRALVCRLLDNYAGIISQRQREVLELYYCEDLSLAEIAENLGITRQGVRDALKHGEESLFNFETILGLIKKNSSISDAARGIADLTEDKKIKELAEQIITLVQD